MFIYHTKETAPAESALLIDRTVKNFGSLVNLHALLAEAPATYEAYHAAFDHFWNDTTLIPLEAQVVMMTSNYLNRCHYCMAGHTAMMKAAKMPDDVIEALREGNPIADSRLEALRAFTRELLEQRGHIGDDRLQVFLDAGFTLRQALEVLAGLAAKLISNFTNALAHTQVDRGMQRYSWVHPDDR